MKILKEAWALIAITPENDIVILRMEPTRKIMLEAEQRQHAEIVPEDKTAIVKCEVIVDEPVFEDEPYALQTVGGIRLYRRFASEEAAKSWGDMNDGGKGSYEVVDTRLDERKRPRGKGL